MYKDISKKEGKQQQELKITNDRALIIGGLMIKALEKF
jgi:hypothetical protein